MDSIYNSQLNKLTSNKKWLENYRTFKEANFRCLEEVFTTVPYLKTVRLHKSEVFNEINASLCISVLTNAKIRHDIDNKLYSILEHKIKEFEDYHLSQKSVYNIEDSFDKWIKESNNYAHRIYKNFITKRVKRKQNFRQIASEKN